MIKRVYKTGWWKVSFDLSLFDESDGARKKEENVRFEDLSETTQEHIINCIREGCTQGQIVEDYELDGEDDPLYECEEQQEFLKQLPGYRECPCGYVGDDFTRRDVNETDTVFAVCDVDIWICPECGKETAETKDGGFDENPFAGSDDERECHCSNCLKIN